jgi:hypothetical protein
MIEDQEIEYLPIGQTIKQTTQQALQRIRNPNSTTMLRMLGSLLSMGFLSLAAGKS